MPADPKDVEGLLQAIKETVAFHFANPGAPTHELAHALGVEIPHAIETIRDALAARGEREPTPPPEQPAAEEQLVEVAIGQPTRDGGIVNLRLGGVQFSGRYHPDCKDAERDAEAVIQTFERLCKPAASEPDYADHRETLEADETIIGVVRAASEGEERMPGLPEMEAVYGKMEQFVSTTDNTDAPSAAEGEGLERRIAQALLDDAAVAQVEGNPTRAKLMITAAKALTKSAPGWRPIETAPKDGTTVLLYDPEWGEYTSNKWGPFVGYYSSGWRAEWTTSEVTPTLWMPLPSAPQEKEK